VTSMSRYKKLIVYQDLWCQIEDEDLVSSSFLKSVSEFVPGLSSLAVMGN